jgi:TPR repeat protein
LSASEVQPEPVPLKALINEAVKRWFDDTLLEAQRGDVKQQALLGQMYAEGYGCTKNPKAAKDWTDRASARGYRMEGVYDAL